MPTFALKRIDSIKGIQTFEKLVVDKVCLLDEFEGGLGNNACDKKKLGSIYQYMEQIAQNKTLPKTKFKDITPDGEKVKEYEFKKNNMRVYVFKKFDGKIVVIGGFKNSQARDIRRFRTINGIKPQGRTLDPLFRCRASGNLTIKRLKKQYLATL